MSGRPTPSSCSAPARDVRHGFEITEDNAAAAAAEICRAVDGLPLLIEMAAAGLRSNPGLDALAAELRGAVQSLKSRRQDKHQRHGSLAALVDWSLAQMPEAQRWALLQLSVFRGPISVDAVAPIIEGIPAGQAKELVEELCSKSLLREAAAVWGISRYRMYRVVREYCKELWVQEATAEQQHRLRRRFADHFIEQAAKWNSQLDTERAGQALDRLEADFENVLSAHEWCLKDRDFARAASAFLGLCGMLRNREQPRIASPASSAASPGLTR